MLTAGMLGLQFALAKTLAAIAIGLGGGVATHLLTTRGLIGEPLRPGLGDGGCAGASVRTPKPVKWRFWEDAGRRAKFGNDAVANTLFLGKWLLLAFLLESLMVAYVPESLIIRTVGGEGWASVATATFVGIPAYLNGYAALPLVSGLIGQGMAPGAGLAFLVAGGITSIPAAMAVFAVARRPVFIAYVGFAVTGSLVAGLAYGLVA
ncbi:MAG: permease [Hyphomicrobiales bacterium]